MAPPESDVTRIVQKYECGFVAAPDDPQDVVAAVRLARQSPEVLERMAVRARVAGLAFAQERELDRFSRLVEGVAQGR